MTRLGDGGVGSLTLAVSPFLSDNGRVSTRGCRMRVSAPMRVLVAVLVFPLAVASLSACGESDAGDLERATRLVRQWTAAWNNNDREALVAIFTEDATVEFTGVHSSMRTGRDEIAGIRVDSARDVEYSEVTAIEGGGFTCEGTYEGAGAKWASELTFELDGDLISHLVHHDELIIPGSSG